MIWSLRPCSRFNLWYHLGQERMNFMKEIAPKPFHNHCLGKKNTHGLRLQRRFFLHNSNCWSDSCDPKPVGVCLFGWLHYQSVVFFAPETPVCPKLDYKTHIRLSMWYLWWLSQRHIRRNTSIDSKIKGTQWRLLLLGSYLLHSLFCQIMWFFPHFSYHQTQQDWTNRIDAVFSTG